MPRILKKQTRAVPFRELHERRPGIDKKIVPGREYTVGFRMAGPKEGVAGLQRETVEATFTLGGGEASRARFVALKTALGTWRAVAHALGVGERHLRKLRVGTEGKRIGAKMARQVNAVAKRHNVKLPRADPLKEFWQKAGKAFGRAKRDAYARGFVRPTITVQFITMR